MPVLGGFAPGLRDGGHWPCRYRLDAVFQRCLYFRDNLGNSGMICLIIWTAWLF